MPKLRECLYEEKTHRGKIRYRFIRHRGAPKIGIKGQPGEPEFERRYNELLVGGDVNHTRKLLRKARNSNYDEGTWGDLVERYLEHMDGQVAKGMIAEGTSKTYGGILKRTMAAIGDAPVASIRKADINQILTVLAPSAATHNNMLKSVRSMFQYAVDHTGLIDSDPTQGVKYATIKSNGHDEWSPAQIKQFLDFHPVGTTAHLALTLLLYAACRRSDVVKLGPKNLKTIGETTYLEFTQTKHDGSSGSMVSIPVDDHFMDVLEATETGNDTFLITHYGSPFTANGFGNRMRKWCSTAGLPKGISAHGIRKSIGSMMAEADCSNYQIMAVHGHSDPRSSEYYTRRARRRKLAEQGREKTVFDTILGGVNAAE